MNTKNEIDLLIKSFNGSVIKSIKFEDKDLNSIRLILQDESGERKVIIGSGCYGLYIDCDGKRY